MPERPLLTIVAWQAVIIVAWLSRVHRQLLVVFVNTNVTQQATMIFTVELWTRLGESMLPARQQQSNNNRSGAQGISTNIALPAGGCCQETMLLPRTSKQGKETTLKIVAFGPSALRQQFSMSSLSPVLRYVIIIHCILYIVQETLLVYHCILRKQTYQVIFLSSQQIKSQEEQFSWRRCN